MSRKGSRGKGERVNGVRIPSFIMAAAQMHVRVQRAALKAKSLPKSEANTFAILFLDHIRILAQGKAQLPDMKFLALHAYVARGLCKYGVYAEHADELTRCMGLLQQVIDRGEKLGRYVCRGEELEAIRWIQALYEFQLEEANQYQLQVCELEARKAVLGELECQP